MKRIKFGLLTICFLTPLTTLAHGEGALIPLIFIETVRLIGLVIFMILIDLNIKGKLLLSVTYILTIILAYRLIGHLSINKYRTTINAVLFFVPVILTTVSYWGLKRRFKRSAD